VPVILDTDHLTILQRRGAESERLLARLDRLAPDDIGTTIVNYQEQVKGWMALLNQSRRGEEIVRAYDELDELPRAFQRMNVLPFTDAAQQRFTEVRKQARRLGTLDIRIASIALATESTLLSRNVRDFRQVPGLRIEDWTV
jgi:tRNA(fMet)-specific endonuclease VapC